MQREKPVLRILSIDGGGLRGIIPLRVLAELERTTGKPAAEMFDVIAGTSTGGVVALALCRPDSNGKPFMSAQQILDVYVKWAPIIFQNNKLRHLPRWVGKKEARAAVRQKFGAIVNPRKYGNARYGGAGLEGLLSETLGDARLGDAITDVVVPTYDWRAGRTLTFRSRAAQAGVGRNPTMAQVAQGTTAAPTYFPPLHLESEGDLDEVVLIDGGLAANNPTSVAYYEGLAEERDLGIDVDFLIVSLGTGRPPEEVPTYQEIFSRSWLKLGMGLMGVIMDGTSEIVDELMRNIMVAKEPYGRYWRFQVDLKDCSLDMDRSDAAHLDHLIAIADELIAERQDDFRQIAEQLATKDLVRAPAAAPDATA